MIPFVSIVIPVYNAAGYLDRCMKTVLTQELTEIEIILVDDGSTDNSPELCDKYAASDNRVHAIHQVNAGPAAARNVGLASADGKWVAFVDPDDYLEPDYCKSAYEAGERARADVVLFDAEREFYDDSGDIVMTKPFVHADNDMEYADSEIFLQLRCGVLYPYLAPYHKDVSLAAPWDKLYLRDFLERYELYFPEELKTLDDMAFNFRVFGKASHICYLHKTLYHYCFNQKSITNKYDGDRINKDVSVFHYIKNEIDGRNVLNRYGISELEQAYYARVIKSFAILCRLCFFSKASPLNKEKQRQLVVNTMIRPEYQEAFNKIDVNILEPKLRFVLFAVQHKSVSMLRILHWLQTRLADGSWKSVSSTDSLT